MIQDHDWVALSGRERDAFAEIEQELVTGDPRFVRLRQGTARRVLCSGWGATVLLVVGALVMVLSVTRSLAVAVGGAILFAAGLAAGLAPARRVALKRFRGATTGDA